MSATRKTFILGVGAQKAGTTWLSRYLASAPGVARGLMKEYHVLDALYVPECAPMRVSAETARISAKLTLRHQMQNDAGTYFEYFARLLQAQDKQSTFDITPSYAAVPAAVLERVRFEFARRNIAAKCVFLMRDPVERCWSALRMHIRDNDISSQSPASEFVSYATSSYCMIRTDYRRTIAAVMQAFPGQDCYLGVHERMFTPAPMKDISEFCGVPLRPEFGETRVNASPDGGQIEPSSFATVARHYRASYEAAREKFPEVEKLWPGFKYL